MIEMTQIGPCIALREARTRLPGEILCASCGELTKERDYVSLLAQGKSIADFCPECARSIFHTVYR